MRLKQFLVAIGLVILIGTAYYFQFVGLIELPSIVTVALMVVLILVIVKPQYFPFGKTDR